MIEKPEWLFKGAIVRAIDKIGTVTNCPTNELQGKVWVYNCQVKLQGEKGSRTYHPSDLTQVI